MACISLWVDHLDWEGKLTVTRSALSEDGSTTTETIDVPSDLGNHCTNDPTQGVSTPLALASDVSSVQRASDAADHGPGLADTLAMGEIKVEQSKFNDVFHAFGREPIHHTGDAGTALSSVCYQSTDGSQR
jgi:hypothetical protein